MSCRPSPLTPQQAAELGGVVQGLREDGYQWKEIADLLGMSAKQLRRYARLHGMSQESRGMSHRGACAQRRSA